MKLNNKKNFLTGIIAIAMGYLSICGINPVAVGYLASAYSEEVNGITLYIATLIGIVFSLSRGKIVEYAIINLLILIMIFIMKKRKKIITNIQLASMTGGIFIGVKAAGIIHTELFAFKALLVIIETVIIISSIVVFRKGIRCITTERKSRIYDREEIISLSIIMTVIVISILHYSNIQIDIVRIMITFSVSLIIVMLTKIISVNSQATQEYIQLQYFSAVNEKMAVYAAALNSLSKSIKNMVSIKNTITMEEVNQIFDSVSTRYCKECSMCSSCWEEDFALTYNTAGIIIESGCKNGRVSEEELPSDFKKRCENHRLFVDDTNNYLEIARTNMHWINKTNEIKGAIAQQIKELSGTMERFSNEVCIGNTIERTDRYLIKNQLKRAGVKVYDMCSFVKSDGRIEIIINTRCIKGGSILVKEVAKIIGDVLNKRFRTYEGERERIIDKQQNIIFVEDFSYRVVTGIARKAKVKEGRCGDNYSIMELDSGETVMMLSDGMGTGKKACEESEKVIDIIEQFIEAGFEKEGSIRLLNSMLIMKEEENNLSTVDMSVINNNTGVCEFIKIGAVATFVKRRSFVETINSSSLPMGILYKTDCEKITKQLYEGDYVIMMTDGVLDGITEDEDKERKIEDLLCKINAANPQMLAEQILNKVIERCEHVNDDMTVLVAGVWKR